MLVAEIALDAALRAAIDQHVDPRHRVEILEDVRRERDARENRSGTDAGARYVRRVIASLQSRDED